VRRHDGVGEVVVQERPDEDREGDRGQGGHRVDGAPGGVAVATAARDGAVERGTDAVEGDGEGEDEGCAADGGHGSELRVEEEA
jgi:hypothetical protein